MDPREEEQTRARKRRIATRRKFRQALRLVRQIWAWGDDLENDTRRARYLRDNMAHCSCWMCGNPRRNEWNQAERLTIQERRAFQDDPWEEAWEYLDDQRQDQDCG